MFRSLATRLTATYVFAAILLTVIVVAAVLAFSLSMFGVASREAMDSVAKEAPFEAKLAIARAGSLRDAAAQIVESLSRPGLRVAVAAIDGDRRRLLAVAVPDLGPDGRPIVERPQRGSRGVLPFGPGPPPGGPSDWRHGNPYPFGLGPFLHVDPRRVAIAGGEIAIVPDPSELDRTIHDFLIAMIPIGIFTIVLAWLLGRFITGQALRPLVETTASLNRFGAGDFTPRPVTTTDRNEIGELVKAYNAAAAQVTAAFEERRLAETRMRQFIADAGHELRTPLTVVMGFIDVLRRRAQSDAPVSPRANETKILTKIYDTMLVESRRMKSLIDKLIELARLENVHERELETVDLGAVAGQVVAALQALEARPRLALRSEGGAIVRGYENELHDALSNLVENALKYAPDAPVDVRVRSDGRDVVVDVTDHGPGIPFDEQELVFSRFYRGRDRGETEGFGLGLAIAKRAVERAKGTIALASVPGQGSAFTIRIPRATRGEAVALAV